MLALLLFLTADQPPVAQSHRNDEYAFEITAPATWQFQKVLQDDLDFALDSSTMVMSLGGDGIDPKVWNGFQFNALQVSLDPLPTITVYAHRKPNQNPEALAKIIEEHLAKWGTKPTLKNTNYTVNGISGLEIEYDIFIPTRIVALYHNGTRYVFHYFVPAPKPKLHKKYRKDFDQILGSFKLLDSSPAR